MHCLYYKVYIFKKYYDFYLFLINKNTAKTAAKIIYFVIEIANEFNRLIKICKDIDENSSPMPQDCWRNQ